MKTKTGSFAATPALPRRAALNRGAAAAWGGNPDKDAVYLNVTPSQNDGTTIHKVVVNTCIPAQGADLKQALEDAKKELAVITGQKPAETKSKKSISNFKLRKGQAIVAKVTLRGDRMYEFLERLIKMALPRIRDFRGVNPNSFDGHGNYSLGLAEQVVFPEIDADKMQHTHGMDITIVTTAKNDDQARELLHHFGLPFRQPVKAH